MIKQETWTGTRKFSIAGRYLELISVPENVAIRTYDGNGNVLDNEGSVGAGFYIDRKSDNETPFSSFEIDTPNNDAVTFFVSRSATGGNKAVSADVSDRAARLLGVVFGSLGVALLQIASNGLNLLGVLAHGTLGALAQVLIGGVNALVVMERGYVAGANFASSTALGSATNEQVFAPASNVNGAWVKFRSAYTEESVVNAPAIITLLAKSSAPAGAIDGELLLGIASHTLQVQTGESGKYAASDGRRFIAAGKGLYWRNSGSAEANGLRAVDYELL